MIYLTYTPCYPLSRFIKSFWYGERMPQRAYERLLPNGAIDIVFNLRDATLRFYDDANLSHPQAITGPVVSGAHDRYCVIDTFQQTSLLGVRFILGGAYPLLGAAADQFYNRRVALEDLWGRSAIELQTRSMEAKTHEARFQRLERFFLSRLTDAVRWIRPIRRENETHDSPAHSRPLACLRGPVRRQRHMQSVLVHVLEDRRRLPKEAGQDEQSCVSGDREAWSPSGPARL